MQVQLQELLLECSSSWERRGACRRACSFGTRRAALGVFQKFYGISASTSNRERHQSVSGGIFDRKPFDFSLSVG